jgi:hypothetical protein
MSHAEGARLAGAAAPPWAYQQNKEAMEKFLKKEYPEIKKEAKRCGGAVYWRMNRR